MPLLPNLPTIMEKGYDFASVQLCQLDCASGYSKGYPKDTGEGIASILCGSGVREFIKKTNKTYDPSQRGVDQGVFDVMRNSVNS